MLVKFLDDITVYPKESEWFQELNDDMTAIKPIEESDFYKNDYIGLKQLDEAKKIQRVALPGGHLQFTQEQITDIFVPFLLS